MSTSYQPLTNPPAYQPQTVQPDGGAYGGPQPVPLAAPYNPPGSYPPHAIVGGQPVYNTQGPNQVIVAVVPAAGGVHEINLVWVQQQVDSTSCYIKILATLILVGGIYSLAASGSSFYTTTWDIVSGVLITLVGVIGLVAACSNRTDVTRMYYYALIGLTAIMAIGYIIVLAMTSADPCRNYDPDGNPKGDNDEQKICEYATATIRAFVVIGALISISCCVCCALCARNHLRNLLLRDSTNGLPSAM